eukprot:gnl/MRDRNA2_/MRDRNA2_115072_c0_seq1.p1 gnl/MRDRNA2_/MRDRNA2_115072_c0~~gnl/MRDRNA2_/MRDRNA2_115072_c0_seq1.p1  ORF type:complete len:539 (-),score=108.11 gnl/MRDRNA2_/MRDRNA2_115072_c0_seq1:159-1775(-)
MKFISVWWSRFVHQALLFISFPTAWSHSDIHREAFLGQKIEQAIPASPPTDLEKQKFKFKNHSGSVMGLLGAEANALRKAKSMVAAEVAMESQAAEYADRVASEAEYALAEGPEPADSLQYTPELAHAAKVYDLGGATVAEWAAKAARAEAEAQANPFSHQARKHLKQHGAPHHSIPVSKYEFEVRLHGLRTAKQAADTAHSWKLALKLRRQIANLEDLENHPQEPIAKDVGDWVPQARAIACFSKDDATRVQHLQDQIDAMEQSMKQQIDKMAHLQQEIANVKLTPNVHTPNASVDGKVPHSQHLKMFSAKQRLNEEDALNLYRLGHVVGALLDRHQIIWWAAGGTLLGAVRNKGIIPHDDDIDYNILNDQSQVLLSSSFKDALNKNGLTMHRVDDGFWQISPLHQKGNAPLHVDVFAMFRTFSACCQENVICYPDQKWHKHTFPASLCSAQPGSKLSDQNTQMSCPQLRRWPFGQSGSVWGPPEKVAISYLNHVYGSDWRTAAHCQDTNHPCGLIANATYDVSAALQPSGPLNEPL